MGIYPLYFQTGKRLQFTQEGDCLPVGNTEAIRAGLDLHVHSGGCALRCCLLRQAHGGLFIEDDLPKPVPHYLIGPAVGCKAHDQDPQSDPGVVEPQRFIQRIDPKPVNVIGNGLGDHVHAVTVGVGLNHCQQRRARPQAFPDCSYIVLQGAATDFKPRQRIHGERNTLSAGVVLVPKRVPFGLSRQSGAPPVPSLRGSGLEPAPYADTQYRMIRG